MAHDARPAKEHLLAALLLGILRLFCRAALSLITSSGGMPEASVMLGVLAGWAYGMAQAGGKACTSKW